MKNNYSFVKKLRYELDDFISKGFWAQVALLVVCGVIFVVGFGIFIKIFLGEESLGASMWTSLMHIIDQGTITADSTNDSRYLIVMLIITVVGMAFTSTIIGIVGNGIQERIDELKKGHSAVIIKNHVVILGFNENTLTIGDEIEEIQNTRKGTLDLVVVDDVPKDEMEHAAKEVAWSRRDPDEEYTADQAKNRKIDLIFRSGDLVSENTFSICAMDRASTIIINGCDDHENIRILLGLSAYLKKCDAYIGSERMPSVVTIIHDHENMTAARIAAGLDDDEDPKIKILNFREIMAKMFVEGYAQISRDNAKKMQLRNFLIIGARAYMYKVVDRMKAFCGETSKLEFILDDPYDWDNVKETMEAHPYWFDKNDDRHLTDIIIMNQDGTEKEEADCEIMVLLLNLRDYIKRHDYDVSITSEMNLPENQALIQIASDKDRVISKQVANRYMVRAAMEDRQDV